MNPARFIASLQNIAIAREAENMATGLNATDVENGPAFRAARSLSDF
jgi:hypothetical protein